VTEAARSSPAGGVVGSAAGGAAERAGAVAAAERPFRLARLALAIVAPVIVYASLRPFHGWRDPGTGLFAFLLTTDGLGSSFDAVLNVVGYLVWSVCLVLALYPRLRGRAALVAGIVLPALCSLSVEAAQAYLPGRVASAADVGTNSLGALLGAWLAVRLTPWLTDHRGGRALRERWLVPGHRTELGLLLLAAWFVGVFAQRTWLFGTGDFRGNLQVAVDPGVPAWLLATAEAFVVGANLLAACLVLRLVLADGAGRRRWFLLLATAALAMRVIAQLAFWPPKALWAWITPGALLGVLAGLAAASALRGLSRSGTARAVIVLAVVAVLAVNLAPADPAVWLQRGSPRESTLIGLVLVSRYASKAWPLLAVAWCAWTLWASRARSGAAAAAERRR